MATYLQNGSCVVISGLTPSLFETRSGDVYFVAVLDIPSQPARQVLYATLCSLRRVSCAVLMALVSSFPRTCLARGASSLPRNLMKFGDMLRCYPSSSGCIVSTPKLLWFAMTIYSFWCLWLRNIQKIISVFVNRTGRICIRVHDEVVRCSRRVKDPWEAMGIPAVPSEPVTMADIMSHKHPCARWILQNIPKPDTVGFESQSKNLVIGSMWVSEWVRERVKDLL